MQVTTILTWVIAGACLIVGLFLDPYMVRGLWEYGPSAMARVENGVEIRHLRDKWIYYRDYERGLETQALDPSLSQERRNQLKSEIDKYEEWKTEAKYWLDKVEKDNAELPESVIYSYLVARGLALGAVGGLIKILVTQKAFGMAARSADALSSMALGALMSVIVLGLFYTKQISIFSPESQPRVIPDYWRVTLVCIIGGALAENVYQYVTARWFRTNGAGD